MGKTSITHITEQLDALNTGIEKLKSGELKTSEVADLTDNARELYEKMVVLRHRAFEKHAGKEVKAPESEALNEEQQNETVTAASELAEEEVAFDFSGKSEEVATENEKDEEQETMFDFSGESSEAETSVEEEQNEVVEESVDAADSADTEIELTDDSLNSMFTDTREGSLRKQLGGTAISDLKSEIGIAKKFEYINSLFAGKAEVYDRSINTLNNCEGQESARNLLNSYAQEFNWDLDNKSIIQFIELVERRHL